MVIFVVVEAVMMLQFSVEIRVPSVRFGFALYLFEKLAPSVLFIRLIIWRFSTASETQIEIRIVQTLVIIFLTSTNLP